MDDWTFLTLEVDETPPAQPALLEEDWRPAEVRRVRTDQQAEAARIAEVEQAEARSVRDRDSAVAPLLFVDTPAAGLAC